LERWFWDLSNDWDLRVFWLDKESRYDGDLIDGDLILGERIGGRFSEYDC
jgi:hypothetical protein